MSIKHNKKLVIYLFVLMSIFIGNVYALPPIPSQFYGEITINDIEAPIGTNITALDPDNVTCDYISTTEIGNYMISCKGDNPDTGSDEGANQGDVITLQVNNITSKKTAIWNSGSFSEIDIEVSSTSLLGEKPSPDISPKKTGLVYFLIVLIISILAILIITGKRGK